MSNFSVISDVSKSLRDILLQSMIDASLPVDVEVHDLLDLQPNQSLLTLFLYEILEDPSARNRPRVRAIDPNGITIQKPRMALLLRYLMTAWSNDQTTNQTILGRVLQTLYDGAILSGAQLNSELSTTDLALKVTLSQLSLEEQTRVWFAIQKPYRLSLVYDVRVVNLDTERTDHLRPVTRRSVGYASPEATQ